MDFVVLFYLPPDKIKQAHLSFQPGLFPSHDIIYNGRIDNGHLMPVTVKPITGTCLDQILDRTFVDVPLHRTFNEILQGAV